MLSHTRMGIPYEYTHMGCHIRVWANICIWDRTSTSNNGILTKCLARLKILWAPQAQEELLPIAVQPFLPY